MFRSLCYTCLALLIFTACSRKQSGDVCYTDEDRKVCLRKNNDSLYYLAHTPVNQPTDQPTDQPNDTFKWELKYPVYQFLFEDITNDGQKEILVGVVKKTRFDSIYRKRVFVFKFVENEIRPLWLGSRLGMPVFDFWVEQKNETNYLKTIEKEKSGLFAVVLYEWDRFGFKFKEYISREKNWYQLKEYGYEE